MNADRVSYQIVDSPIGPLLLTAEGEALTGVAMGASEGDLEPLEHWRRGSPLLARAAAQLSAYFEGERRGFDLPLALRGTTFQRLVWDALPAIPFGRTISYAELARRIGVPGSARAVGGALGRNPIAVVVPCHRVIGSDGRLTGFGGGVDRKRWLLEHEHEREVDAPPSPSRTRR